MTEGFGWNFYAFFVYAALWLSGFFIWAFRANRRERRKSEPRD